MFNKTITIYYACIDNLPILPPEKFAYDFSSELKIHSPNNLNMLKCPAIMDYCKNLYKIFPTFDYEIEFDGSNVFSNLYDQQFFDDVIITRDLSKGFFSYNDPKIIFFSEDENVCIEVLPPYFHLKYNDIRYVVGAYNIGKHLRKLELPMWFSKPSKITILKKDPLYYVRFLTDKKIVLKKFFFTKEIRSLVHNILFTRDHKFKNSNLEYYYDLVQKSKFRNMYLKLIKQNLME